MMEVMNNTPFLAFTRIALNNWHYISRKVLFKQGNQLFTGYSGSGKIHCDRRYAAGTVCQYRRPGIL